MSRENKSGLGQPSKIHHTEPLIRLTKNNVPTWKAWTIRIGAVLLAAIVCALFIVLVTGLNPLEVYKKLFTGSFGTKRKFWNMLQGLAMLLIVSLAVTPAFKMRFWNIGAEGQVLAGAIGTAAVMIYGGNVLPPYVLFPLMIVVSVVCGVIWGLIPAVFKAYFNTNETLFTLMMNYVATQLVAFLITLWENPKGSNTVGIINPKTMAGWFPAVFGQKHFINIAVVLVLTVVIFIYLKYSKHGYEISVVGESENTARYIGINVKKVIIRTMALSGALCGIAGLLLVAGTSQTISTATAGGRGFTAIMVSWLAKFNPLGMILTSFLLIFFERGAGEIATAFRLNESVADIMTGIILFFIIGSEFFINYKVKFRSSHHREGGAK